MRNVIYLLICLLWALLILGTLPCFGSIGGQEATMKITGDTGLICGTLFAPPDPQIMMQQVEHVGMQLFWAALWILEALIAAKLAFDFCPLIVRAFRRRRKGDGFTPTPDNLSENPPTGRTE